MRSEEKVRQLICPSIAGTRSGKRCLADRNQRTHSSSLLTPHPSPKARRTAAGFTLIELLVVTVIIGIGLALAIANLRPDDAQAARRHAAELAAQLEQLQERAVFGGKAVGVSFSAEGLQTWQRSPKGDWAPLPPAANIRNPEITLESVKIGAQEVDAETRRLVFLPDGISLPFELTVSRGGHRFLITGSPLGRIELKALS